MTTVIITNKGWEEGVAGDWAFTNLLCTIQVDTDKPKSGSYNLHILPIFSDSAQWAQARYTISGTLAAQLRGRTLTFSINRYITSADTVTRLGADELYIRISDDVGTSQTLCGYVNPDMWIAHSVARVISNTATIIYLDILYDKPLNAHRHHYDIDDMDALSDPPLPLLVGGLNPALQRVMLG